MNKQQKDRQLMFRRLNAARRIGNIKMNAFDVSFIMAIALDMPKEHVLDEMLDLYNDGK